MITNDDILLSVIITAHEQSAEVAKMLGRLEDDDLRGSELIVIDDHSTPGEYQRLSDAVDAWTASRIEDKLTTIITTERLSTWGGAGGARNRGEYIAVGKYLWFVDGDDEICSGAIARMVKDIADAKIAEDIILIPYSEGPAPDRLAVHTLDEMESCPQPFMWRIAPWGKLISRRVFVPFRERVLFEDTDWHYRVCDLAYTRRFLRGRPCYIYRTDVVGSQMHDMRALTPKAVAGRVAMVGRILNDLADGNIRQQNIRKYLKTFVCAMLETVMPTIQKESHA